MCIPPSGETPKKLVTYTGTRGNFLWDTAGHRGDGVLLWKGNRGVCGKRGIKEENGRTCGKHGIVGHCGENGAVDWDTLSQKRATIGIPWGDGKRYQIQEKNWDTRSLSLPCNPDAPSMGPRHKRDKEEAKVVQKRAKDSGVLWPTRLLTSLLTSHLNTLCPSFDHKSPGQQQTTAFMQKVPIGGCGDAERLTEAYHNMTCCPPPPKKRQQQVAAFCLRLGPGLCPLKRNDCRVPFGAIAGLSPPTYFS